MHFTPQAKATLQYLLTLDVPASAYVGINDDGSIQTQCNDQAVVRAFRAAFGGGLVWHKSYSEGCKWWEYETTLPQLGIAVRIYACYEAPPTCKAIEEEYEAEEQVPVKFVTRRVTKTRLRWDCSGDAEVQ